MNLKEEQIINSIIYLHPDKRQPTRYQMIRLSSWRVYLHQELQSFRINDLNKLINQNLNNLLPQLFKTQNKDFYDYLTGLSVDNNKDLKDTYRQDLISHFICRMLYAQEPKHQEEFINYEKTILEIRLKKSIQKMKILVDTDNLQMPESQWNNLNIRKLIIQGSVIYDKEKAKQKKNLTKNDFAKIPFQFAQAGLKKRRCYVAKGFVYAHQQVIIDMILSAYGDYLRKKLIKAKKSVNQILENDTQNQLSYFLLQSLDSMNQASQQQTEVQSTQKLTLKNIQGLWSKYFPPCMMHLTQVIKTKGHLKHDGRRQLWLFFKGCGMSSLDNQQYFRKHMGLKVSESEMKGHIYNIQHAYGEVGKRQQQNPKICRNIITGPPAKKDQNHGCPFRHWGNDELSLFLKTRYRISQNQLNKIMNEKSQNRFQIACGNLFESLQVNNKLGKVPQEISAKLGKSPHGYFQAAMQLAFKSQKSKEPKSDNKMEVQMF